jgi:hypothetical protein
MALGQRSATTSPMSWAASALTREISLQRVEPRRSKKLLRVARSRPGATHTSRRLSWSTTTLKKRWPRL